MSFVDRKTASELLKQGKSGLSLEQLVGFATAVLIVLNDTEPKVWASLNKLYLGRQNNVR